MQRLKISDKSLAWGSTRFKCRYSTRSGPGAVFAEERSFAETSCGETSLYRWELSSVEGETVEARASVRAAVSHVLVANICEKNWWASSREPV